jgi:serine protease Do
MKKAVYFLLITIIAVAMILTMELGVNRPSSPQNSLENLQEAFISVAETSFPSIVIVKTQRKPSPNNNYPWHRFNSPQTIIEPTTRGSGFIIDKKGYIITNNHVVANSDSVIVQLNDGKELPAKIVGTDWKTDLAVLKVENDRELPSLKLANSDQVKVGSWAIAIGAPFNLDYSMTVGVVSQKGRAMGLNIYENYIQTDALINPGNSGGPLLNTNGEVIGINDFIITTGASQSGGGSNSGLGFAIPSNMAQNVVNQIISKGHVSRPWLGISMQTLNEKLKKQYKIDKGVLVRGVFSGDPADKAGLQPGDIIIKTGDQEVNSSREVQFAVLKYQPNDKIPLLIIRDGKEMLIEVVSGQQSVDRLGAAKTKSIGSKDKFSNKLKDFGITLEERNDGLYIADLTLPVKMAGLKVDMKIIAINRYKVDSIAQAEEAASINENQILLYVEDGHSRFFAVLSKH